MTGSTTRARSMFGHYEILGLLGSGGMGEVYEAHDTVKDRIVALKILAGEHSGDEMFRGRFRRESRAAAQLQESHVIPIHDRGEVPSNARVCPTLSGNSGAFTRSAAGTSVTSCEFAEAVRVAYGQSGPPDPTPRVIMAYSEVTDEWYPMTCAADGLLATCSGGEDAVVYAY